MGKSRFRHADITPEKIASAIAVWLLASRRHLACRDLRGECLCHLSTFAAAR